MTETIAVLEEAPQATSMAKEAEDGEPVEETTIMNKTSLPKPSSSSSSSSSSSGSSLRLVFLVFSIVNTLLYSGAIYGWGPMQLLLEDSGVFGSRCRDNDVDDSSEVCDAQTAALLNARLVGQLNIMLSPVMGYVADRWGAPTIAYFMALSQLVGLAALLLAAEYNNSTGSRVGLDGLLYPACFLIGASSSAGGLLTVNTGLVFEGVTRNRVISAMNTFYDASATTYLGLWAIGQLNDNATLTHLLGGYIGLGVLIMGGTCFLWKRVVRQQQQQLLPVEEENTSLPEYGGDSSGSNNAKDDGNNSKEGGDVALERPLVGGASVDSGLNKNDESPQHGLDAKAEDGALEKGSSPTNDRTNAKQIISATTTETPIEDAMVDEEENSDYIIIAQRGPRDQLLSEPVLLLGLFFNYQQMSNIWTLTTTRDHLKDLGDDEEGNKYLTIFTLFTPMSIVALPLVDVMMNKYGFHAALQSVNALAILHGVIRVSSRNLNVQVAGFVVFSFFRCFLFSVSLSTLPALVSGQVVGRAVGYFYMGSGVLFFATIPLANVTVNQLDGNFFVPNLIFLLCSLPFIYVVWRVGQGLERERVAKEKQEQQKQNRKEQA